MTSKPTISLFERMVRGEVSVDAYVADVKRRVDTALEVRDAMRRHRQRKPIAFAWWRPWR